MYAFSRCTRFWRTLAKCWQAASCWTGASTWSDSLLAGSVVCPVTSALVLWPLSQWLQVFRKLAERHVQENHHAQLQGGDLGKSRASNRSRACCCALITTSWWDDAFCRALRNPQRRCVSGTSHDCSWTAYHPAQTSSRQRIWDPRST